ncbi:peptide deformylase [Candidatus Zinderia insecticola CARI]|uniref:Peptide deformylase n=1 Tax=Zinderia insecticola (strain CARI) TaxID=871271 RepID=E0TIZ7_ZINIC|nr:peptide deformylase [Candidatus Zinderia insecticola CARI]
MVNIINYPNKNLFKISKKIYKINNKIKNLIFYMSEIMYNLLGIGLSAIQINKKKKIFIIDISKNKNKLKIFINSKILYLSKKKIYFKEGCLSFPGIYKNIKRSIYIKIIFINIKGKFKIYKSKNIFSICIQHEIEHINGKIFLN